jgi:outer membrane receptor for Fe3+-dicitrate
VWSYELGAKRRFDDGKILLSTSAFWINWKRIQGIIPLNTCAYSYTGNFGTAVSRGFDVQGLYEPIKGLEFSGTIALTDAQYTQTVPVPGDATQLLVKNGDPLLFTPRWTGTVGVGYTWPARDGVDAYLRSDANYTGNYYRTYSQSVNGYLASIRDGQSITQVQLRGGIKTGAFDASVFVKNLTDNSTPLAEDAGTVPGTYGYSAIRAVSLQPRTIGVALTYRY